MALAVESLMVIALVVGVLWIVRGYWFGGSLAKIVQNPKLWLLILVISALGTVINLAQYYVGKRGTEAIFARFPNLEGERWERIEKSFRRWGARLLLLVGVPGLGIALTMAAGAFAIQRSAFLLWVFMGKVLRNVALAFLFYSGYQLIEGRGLF
jgi:membrane protein YqaA with SNARE-associated domain